MRSKLSISLLSALFLAVLLCSSASASFHGIFGGKGIKGSGHMETREFNLETVTAISIHGAFDLNVKMGNKQEINATIDDNLWDNLEIKVKNGTLVLDWDESCRPDSHCSIDLVLPRLDKVAVHGACDANIDNYHGDSFFFKVSGAGELEINGKVNDLKIEISGAADIDTRDLKAENVNVSISGAGNATVHANKSIKAQVSGVGSLIYYGDPEEKSTHVSGIGSIKSK